ncbi:MAG: FAD-dependent oxidoreductase [Myxococcaceae bacterium]
MTTERVDVLVIGAGMAGSSTAAALASLGREVVLVDAPMDRSKQLAGELIHPPGVAHLRRLGLGNALDQAGARDVLGFAVVSAKGDVIHLPYDEVPGIEGPGAAVDHAGLMVALANTVAALPRVQLRRNTRVAALSELDSDAVTVTLATGDTLQARLVVAADGRGSAIRRMAKISEARTPLSTMLGLTVPADVLPHEGFGHVYVDGGSVVLAYRINHRHARVMIDVERVPENLSELASDNAAALAALSPAFRKAVREALQRRPLTAANVTMIPEQTAKGRVALVGDAAGCCHPLTASGLTSCANDALALARAVQQSGANEREALHRYTRARQAAQRTRINLATAIYQALGDSSPQMELLRRGLFRYWRESPEGRAASMGLLSGHDARMRVMAREYVRVMGHSLPEWMSSPRQESWRRRSKTMIQLVRSAMPWITQTVRGAFDDVPFPRLFS